MQDAVNGAFSGVLASLDERNARVVCLGVNWDMF